MLKKIMIGVIIIAVLGAAIIYYYGAFRGNSLDNTNALEKQSMLESTLEWGRLAPIPESKTNYQIKTEGSAFTRSFRCNFNLPDADLQKWMQDCPGLQDAKVENISDTQKKYSIKPGGGAQYAEAVINFQSYFVEIVVYWS